MYLIFMYNIICIFCIYLLNKYLFNHLASNCSLKKFKPHRKCNYFKFYANPDP